MKKWSMMFSKSTGARFARNNQTGERIDEATNPAGYAAARRRWQAAARTAARDEAFLSCGLVKVRGAVSGATYWE